MFSRFSTSFTNQLNESEISGSGMTAISIKCVVIGSSLSSKTALLDSYISKQVEEKSSPDDDLLQVSDSYVKPTTMSNLTVTMGFFNTAGQEDYDRLRPLSYPQTDVFLLCFSIVSQSSFYDLKERFVSEIKFHCPAVPIILVGTECHLKTDPNCIRDMLLAGKEFVTREMVRQLVDEIKAVKYVECSTYTKKGVDLVFQEAAIAALDYRYSENNNQQLCSVT